MQSPECDFGAVKECKVLAAIPIAVFMTIILCCHDRKICLNFILLLFLKMPSAHVRLQIT